MTEKKAGQRRRLRPNYWNHRVRSTAFKRLMTELVSQELASLASETVQDVVDADGIRRAIRDWKPGTVDPDVVADLVIDANRFVADKLMREPKSLQELLDRPLARDIEALLHEAVELPPSVEDLVKNLMQQEFIRQLFTDVIFTAIVAFNRRVNPFLAAVTTRVLEEQIKGFIRLFMPMLQQQATAFAVNPNNQRVVLEFTRAFVRQLLEQPLRDYADLASPTQRRQAEALLRKALRNPRLQSLLRDTALSAWEQFYKRVRRTKVGEFGDLQAHAPAVAARILAVLGAATARPEIAAFLDAEVALANRRPRS